MGDEYKNRINESENTEWSYFSIKILGINFGNSILDNSNVGQNKHSKKIHIWN